MPATDDDRLREELDEAECRRLLGTATVGRLSFTHGALPAIVPVSFTLLDRALAIPADRDSPVAQAVRGAVVALEAGSYDPAIHIGWSVTAVGPSHLVTSPQEVARIDGLHARPDSPSRGRCYICLEIGLISGWRVSRPPAVDRAGASRPRP
jgi:hypothetical protein